MQKKQHLWKLTALFLLGAFGFTVFVHSDEPVQFAITALPAGDGPRSITVGDFNGDGALDLAVGNISSHDVSILIGDGSGGFDPAGSFPVGMGPHQIVVGDFDGNGTDDLATVNKDSDDLSVLLGDGNGGFGTAKNFPTGKGTRGVALGDFNQDGAQDLAVVNSGTGTMAGDVLILLGDGAGDFGPGNTLKTGFFPVPVALGDLNGDGLSDLVVANRDSHQLSIFLGETEPGSFSTLMAFPVGAGPISIAIDDFNDDQKPDLVVVNQFSNTVSVLLGDGDGGFGNAFTNYLVGESPKSVAVDDFDQDGELDLAVANSNSGTVSILMGNGQGGFGNRLDFPVGAGPHSVAIGDFDNDGKADLAVANRGTDDVSILINQTGSSQQDLAQAERVQEFALIQRLYDRYFPDPIIVVKDTPVRFYITTVAREHVNRINIQPFVSSTDVVLPGKITAVDFTPDQLGTFDIRNDGHGFTGKLIVVEDAEAVRQLIVQQGLQQAGILHSLLDESVFPDTIEVLKDIPLILVNTGLIEQHWVRIEPWVEAPQPSEPGNVRPREILTFEFTPDQAGEFQILHTVHGFSGTMIVEDTM